MNWSPRLIRFIEDGIYIIIATKDTCFRRLSQEKSHYQNSHTSLNEILKYNNNWLWGWESVMVETSFRAL